MNELENENKTSHNNIMFNHIKKDYDYGINQEMALLSVLQANIDKDLQPATSKFSVIDFTSNNTNVELKTRRNYYNTYQDTMIGYNKIQKLLTDKKDGYAVFNFLDGVYYIEIVESNVKKFRLAEGGRCDRGRIEKNKYYYIPINILKSIQKK